MTFALHGWRRRVLLASTGSTNSSDARWARTASSIVLSPPARGNGGFYVDELEYDLFEAWNDVARHYSLDRATDRRHRRVDGRLRHLPARPALPAPVRRALPIIPAISRGIWFPGVAASGGEQTLSNRWVENARNLPIFHIGDMASELTFYPGQAQHAIGPAVNGLQSLESNGYRYRFWSVAIDHLAIGTNFPEVTEFLGRHTRSSPNRSTSPTRGCRRTTTPSEGSFTTVPTGFRTSRCATRRKRSRRASSTR